MRFIIFSAAAIRQAESNLFNVDVLYRESSLDEFRVEPMKSAPGRKKKLELSLVNPMACRETRVLRSSRYLRNINKKIYIFNLPQIHDN